MRRGLPQGDSVRLSSEVILNIVLTFISKLLWFNWQKGQNEYRYRMLKVSEYLRKFDKPVTSQALYDIHENPLDFR